MVIHILGCPRQEVIGSMVRINEIFMVILIYAQEFLKPKALDVPDRK